MRSLFLFRLYISPVLSSSTDSNGSSGSVADFIFIRPLLREGRDRSGCDVLESLYDDVFLYFNVNKCTGGGLYKIPEIGTFQNNNHRVTFFTQFTQARDPSDKLDASYTPDHRPFPSLRGSFCYPRARDGCPHIPY